MNLSPRSYAIILASAFTFLGCDGSGSAPASGKATIAVATNFEPAMADLSAAFTAETGYELDIVAGSTGKLYFQIARGAAIDAFLAADVDRPDRLIEDGLAAPESQFTYAIGRLVLWDPSGDDVGPDRLNAPNRGWLAIANPDLAPYGRAAYETLATLGGDTSAERDIVKGESVGQTLAFAATGGARLAFVAQSQIETLPEPLRGSYWRVPAEMHAPIRQDAVLVTRGADNLAALAFMDFLASDVARDIIEELGYDTEDACQTSARCG